MSSASIATAAPLLCCASSQVKEAARTTITANEPILGLTCHFICSLPATLGRIPARTFTRNFRFAFRTEELYAFRNTDACPAAEAQAPDDGQVLPKGMEQLQRVRQIEIHAGFPGL